MARDAAPQNPAPTPLAHGSGKTAAHAPAARSARVTVHCARPATAISPLIYGISAGEYATGETAHRVGGNVTSRLNWEPGNLWNTGADWFFENISNETSVWDWIETARGRSLELAVVVPTIGWVAKDGSSVGFPRSRFGQQRKHDPHRPAAGDGHTPDGKPIAPAAPTLTSTRAPPELIKRWILRARRLDRERGSRGIHMYILDNEPALWNKTHRDVHPQPLTYEELLDRTIRYGTVIREADPDAVIAGPAAWGWPEYFTSARDSDSGGLLGPDRLLHGGTPLLAWYLRKLAEHERRTGVRILDVVDVHHYPQADGVYGDKSDPATAARRLRSTRALWDDSYKDESWIDDTVRLIPRLKAWISENYPGRGISLGEWSFGGENHVSGALAIAEALGRFGQLGLTSAFYWRSLKAGTPGAVGFRAFRNFDGKGARFLDLSVPTSSSPGFSLFASRNAALSRAVIIALNLDPNTAVRAQLDLPGCGALRSQRRFTYTEASRDLQEVAADEDAGKAKQFVAPPSSITVLELSLGRETQ
jgi:hypothetical protein